MNADEFKAWFDGYCDGIGGRVPTKAQWDRIREKVAELRGSASYPVVIPSPIWVEKPNPWEPTWITTTTADVPSTGGFAVNTNKLEIN